MIHVGDAIWFCPCSFFSFFFLFFFIFSFFPPLLSGPYLWNRYLQRLQIECAAWSCCLILNYSLPSNSLCYLFIFFFFSAKILSGPYLWNRYSQRFQIECVAWSCCLILHYSLPGCWGRSTSTPNISCSLLCCKCWELSDCTNSL